MTDTTTVSLFTRDEIEIERALFQITMSDGERLCGYRYKRLTPVRKGRNAVEPLSTPLLMLPSELGNSAEYHEAVLQLLTRDGAPVQVLTLDLRGRGLSIGANPGNTDVTQDADDIISVCDALNLHHIHTLVSGRSSVPLLLTLPKRPGLVQRLVLNDAAPEYDSVGIARETALRQRQAAPSTWVEAVELLKQAKGESFSMLDAEDWEAMSRARWRDDNGKPVANYNPALQRFSNAVSYDEKQTTLWPEFAILKTRPVMMLRGENSLMVTPDIQAKTAKANGGMVVKVVSAQGHSPLLHKDNLMGEVLSFLRSGEVH